MPVLPGYEQRRNINANTPEPLRNEASQKFEDQQKVIGTLAGITEKWSQANDIMQYTKARADYEVAAEQINTNAQEDPDPYNADKYIKELEDAKNKSVSGISNQEIAQKVGAQIDLSNRINAIRIDTNFKHKQLKANQYNVETFVNTKTNAMATATEAEKMGIQKEIEYQLDLSVRSGVLSPEEAGKILLNSKESSATVGIFTNPDGTIEELKKSDGFYKEIPIDKRMKLIERARDYKEKQQKEATEMQKEIIYNNEAEIALGFSQGNPPNIQKLSEMVRNGTISSDFANIALKVATSKDSVNAITSNEEFSKLTKEVFSSKNKEEVQKAIKNILMGGGDGKLSKDDLEVLLQSAMSQTKKDRAEIEAGIKTLGDWADNTKPIHRAEVYRDFQKKVLEGKTPQDAVAETISINTIKAKPNFISFPKEGKLMVDKNGNKARVFPDGHFEEVK